MPLAAAATAANTPQVKGQCRWADDSSGKGKNGWGADGGRDEELELSCPSSLKKKSVNPITVSEFGLLVVNLFARRGDIWAGIIGASARKRYRLPNSSSTDPNRWAESFCSLRQPHQVLICCNMGYKHLDNWVSIRQGRWIMLTQKNRDA